MAPLINVLPTKYVEADAAHPDAQGLLLTLAEALQLLYDTDAHYQSARLVGLPAEAPHPRLSKASIIPQHVADIVHDVITFDLDTPGHVPLCDAPAVWAGNLTHWRDTSPLGRACTYYATRNGYRLVFELDAPVSYQHYGAAARLLAAELARQGCPPVDPLFDFARVMRLPLVVRDGQPTDPDAGPLGAMRVYDGPAPWHVSHAELEAASTLAPVRVRRRLADGSTDGIYYSGLVDSPRPEQPAAIPQRLQTQAIRAALTATEPLSHPGARHGDTLRALGRVALDLGSHATPDLLYAALHPAYQAMCAAYPDSDLDKLWCLAHEVSARHLGRIANGEQEDAAPAALVRGVVADLQHAATQAAEAAAGLPLPDPTSGDSLCAYADQTSEGHLRAALDRLAEQDGRRSWPILATLQGGGANDLWVFDRYNARYTGPTNARALPAVIRKCGWASLPSLINPDTGDLTQPAPRLLVTFGAVVQEVRSYYADGQAGDCVDEHANHGAGVLWLAGARRDLSLQPVFDPQIDTWLHLLCGGDDVLHAHLCLWLAAVPEASDVTRHTIPALMILGKKGTGKTLLAVGLAALWGTTALGHEEAFARFNARLANHPMIDGSEFSGSLLKPGRAGEGHDLRVIISQAPKQLEQKFLAPTTLVGAPRLILSANDFGAWGDSQLEDDAYQALVDRIAVLQPPDDARDYLTGLKASDPDVIIHWAARGIAEHALWLQTNTDLSPSNPLLTPPPRFRVPSFGHASSEEDTLRRIGDDGKLGLEALVRGCLVGHWAPLHQDEAVFIAGTALYVTQAVLAAVVAKQAGFNKQSTLRRVLGKLTSIGRAEAGAKLPRALRSRGTRTDDERRYVVVPLDLLTLYAEHLGIEVDSPACAAYTVDGALLHPAT